MFIVLVIADKTVQAEGRQVKVDGELCGTIEECRYSTGVDQV